MRAVFEECPRFEGCCCNKCPLDPEAHMRDGLRGEEACRARRAVRESIAARFPDLLPGRGLLPREMAQDSARAAFAEKLAAMSPEARASWQAAQASGAARLRAWRAEKRADSLVEKEEPVGTTSGSGGEA